MDGETAKAIEELRQRINEVDEKHEELLTHVTASLAEQIIRADNVTDRRVSAVRDLLCNLIDRLKKDRII